MYDGNDEYLWQSIGLVVRVTSSISCHSQKEKFVCLNTEFILEKPINRS